MVEFSTMNIQGYGLKFLPLSVRTSYFYDCGKLTDLSHLMKKCIKFIDINYCSFLYDI